LSSKFQVLTSKYRFKTSRELTSQPNFLYHGAASADSVCHNSRISRIFHPEAHFAHS
jgi:hypothetical protein